MNSNRFLIQSACMLVAAISLSACESTKEYSSIEPGDAAARSRANLELPPDLISTSSDALASRATEESATETEVLPETRELNVERNDAEGWLEVDASPDRAWRMLESHWGALGVDLVVADPEAGIMETDWVEPPKAEDGEESFTTNLVKQFLGQLVDDTTALDKYTIQLERVDEGRTRINVTHRGIRKIQTRKANIATNAEWEWVETDEDPQKVKRALSSIVYGLRNSTS